MHIEYADIDGTPDAIDRAFDMVRSLDVQSPLGKRMAGLRSMVAQLTKEATELGEKLGPVLVDKDANGMFAVPPTKTDSAEAPLVAQLDALSKQLCWVKNELHMIRCRACC